MLFLAPLLAALIYPFGSLGIKQAQSQGAGPWQIAVVGNLIIAACFMAVFVLGPEAPNWDYFVWPILAGCCFFGGQFFTVLAFRFGDVSMVAPLMGCKILFVALYSSLLGVESLSPTVWAAAVLAAVAIFLLGMADKKSPENSNASVPKKSPWVSIVLALTATAIFGGVDTIFSHAGEKFGKLSILIAAMVFFALFSLAMLPLARREPKAPQSTKAIVLANLAFGFQAVVLNFANVMLAKPTIVNIVYSSRGLFGITHTWFIGHWFENRERAEVSSTVMIRRCFGATLLMISIVLVVIA